MTPSIGDIWQWTNDTWDTDTSTFNIRIWTILILTEPVKEGAMPDSWAWTFDALELDGDESGVVEGWHMVSENFEAWRKIA